MIEESREASMESYLFFLILVWEELQLIAIDLLLIENILVVMLFVGNGILDAMLSKEFIVGLLKNPPNGLGDYPCLGKAQQNVTV